MIPQGKGFYIWKIARCAGGDVRRLVELAKGARLSHVSVKVQEGIAPYKTEDQQERLADLVPALRAAKIAVFGWGYLYGNKWFRSDGAKREAAATLEMIDRWGLDGFHIDAEVEYKRQNSAANIYANTLIASAPKFSFGLSSYRFPSLHPEFPWREFLRACDHHYPQVYWDGAHNPTEQLFKSVRELRALKDIPVVPVGSAYRRGNWVPTEQDVSQFMLAAKNGQLPGCSFWEWMNTEAIPNLWNIVEYFDWGQVTPPPQVLTIEERVALIEAQARGHGWNV